MPHHHGSIPLNDPSSVLLELWTAAPTPYYTSHSQACKHAQTFRLLLQHAPCIHLVQQCLQSMLRSSRSPNLFLFKTGTMRCTECTLFFSSVSSSFFFLLHSQSWLQPQGLLPPCLSSHNYKCKPASDLDVFFFFIIF